jgi:hypothetical protein
MYQLIKRPRKAIAKGLPSYEDACHALAQYANVADVIEIEDRAAAIEVLAQREKNPDLLRDAVRIKFEATRNIGRIIIEMQGRGELADQSTGRPPKISVVGDRHIKTLKDLGISRDKSSNAQWLFRLPQKRYHKHVESIVATLIRMLNAVFRQASRDSRKSILHKKTEIVSGLHVGDFRDLSPQIIPDESVQLIFTDPPYDGDSTHLYGSAAKEAARILKPGGSFIAYSGRAFLPKELELIGEHLKYFWTCATIHTQDAQMKFTGIKVGWKPLLWFVKDYRGDTQTYIRDVIMSPSKQKDFHPWQQTLTEANHFIEPLTDKGDTVVDFFVGGGTTLVAAKKLHRNYVGFEIDKKTAERAADRLMES